jgi:hypothetical protein
MQYYTLRRILWRKGTDPGQWVPPQPAWAVRWRCHECRFASAAADGTRLGQRQLEQRGQLLASEGLG